MAALSVSEQEQAKRDIIYGESDKKKNIRFDGKHSWVQCLAHVMNLIVKDLMHDLNLNCVQKIRKIVWHICCSPQNKQQWSTIYCP
jgi:hypothetical protein